MGLSVYLKAISVYLKCHMGQCRHEYFHCCRKFYWVMLVPGYFQFGFDAEIVVAI